MPRLGIPLEFHNKTKVKGGELKNPENNMVLKRVDCINKNHQLMIKTSNGGGGPGREGSGKGMEGMRVRRRGTGKGREGKGRDRDGTG